MSNNISALVIGCGSIGERHAQNLAQLGVEIELYDSDTTRMEELSGRYDVPKYDSLNNALQASPDLAFICTPHDSHVSLAREVLKRKCDIFIEKPISNRKQEAVDLIHTVQESDIVHMIGCNYRFHPAIATVKNHLERKDIGEVYSANINLGSYLPDWHPWEDHKQMYSAKPGVGGVLLDNIHAINFANWFFGEAKSIMAYVGYDSSLGIPTEDRANMVVEYDEGILCTIMIDYLNRPSLFSGHIIGELGSIRWGPTHESVQIYDPESQSWIDSTGYKDWELNEMYLAMTDHLLRCVSARKPTVSPLQDGVHDLKIALAAKESNAKGKRVILSEVI
jgi:predicted dehydrogenase